jgi:hypothetical protein
MARAKTRPLAVAVAVAFCCALAAPASIAQGPLPTSMGRLTRLTCAPGQRVVVEVRPVESPFVGGAVDRKANVGGFFAGLSLGFAMGGVGGALAAAGRGPDVTVTDVSAKLGEGVRAVFGRIDVNRQLLTSIERAMQPVSPCELAFMTTDERRKAELTATDRFLVFGLYLEYRGGDPRMIARLGALQVSRPEDLTLIDEGVARMAELSAELTRPGKRPSLAKAKEAQKLAEGLMPLAQSVQSEAYESPSHRVDAWLAQDGHLVETELTAALDTLLPKLTAPLRQ